MSWTQECSECRGCCACYSKRERCAQEMDAQFEKDMIDEMERRHLQGLDMEREALYLQGLENAGENNGS